MDLSAVSDGVDAGVSTKLATLIGQTVTEQAKVRILPGFREL
jgi:hypothetical protein